MAYCFHTVMTESSSTQHLLLLALVYEPHLSVVVSVLIFLHFAFCLYLQHTTQTPMLPAGFKPTTPASDRPQTHAFDRSATGIGFDPRTFQPAASRYTDYTILAHMTLKGENRSTRRKTSPGHDSKPVHVGFAMDKALLRFYS
jgi:hypothetical protein